MDLLPIELVWHIGEFLGMKDHIEAKTAYSFFSDPDRLRRKRYDWFKRKLCRRVIKDELSPGWCGDTTCYRQRAACIHIVQGFTEILSCYCSEHCQKYYHVSPIEF